MSKAMIDKWNDDYGETYGDEDYESCVICLKESHVDDEQMTYDLGDTVCRNCYAKAARVCVVCKEKMGCWNGMDTPSGFVCDVHYRRRGMPCR